jgi:hypothetical protein
MGIYADVRYAVGLSVIALGAILAFGVTASPESVNIQVIGLILILTGLAGLGIAHKLSVTRRRTDVIYGSNGVTLLEPNSPPPHGNAEQVERDIDSLPPDEPALPPAPDIVPGARIAGDPQARVSRVDGVMDAEPGSEEFFRLQRDWI